MCLWKHKKQSKCIMEHVKKRDPFGVVPQWIGLIQTASVNSNRIECIDCIQTNFRKYWEKNYTALFLICQIIFEILFT